MTAHARSNAHYLPRHLSSPDLARHFEAVRSQTEALIQPLSPEDCQLQSMPDASPAKWHLAHVTWFFETFVLEKLEPGFQPFDASFRVLFNSYYQGVGEQYPRPQRGLMSRPSLQEVLSYRRAVNERVQALLANRPDDPALAELVTLGLHHEQQHQELLLTDIKHALSFNPHRPAYAQRWPLAAVAPQPLAWVAYEGGLLWQGYERALDGPFTFDHETPRHPTFVRPFEMASRLVTNGELMAFTANGGYQRPELWLALGWDWVQQTGARAPLYWHGREGEVSAFSNFTLQGEVAVDSHTPACHLSFFEADAYARWAGARLPTEQEWELSARLAFGLSRPSGNLLETQAFHPLPLQSAATGRPAQLWGDVWEWTASNYNPYPGYQPWAGAVGEYNGKFMCNQFVLRGGSCVTPHSHLRNSYRNFFPPQAQWQFSGLRLARDA